MPHSAWAPPIACPPHDGVSRALRPRGVDGVGSHPNDSDIPRSENPSTWCTTSVRTRTSSDSPVTPIGPNDMLIAAQALALELTVVSANVDELMRVPGLHVENWLDAAGHHP